MVECHEFRYFFQKRSDYLKKLPRTFDFLAYFLKLSKDDG